jgi:hypothetical protein
MTIDIPTSRPTPEILQAYRAGGQHLKDLVDAGDLTRLPVLTADNIEPAKNAEGSASTSIRTAYERFFDRYLRENAAALRIDPMKVIVGKGYTPAELGLQSVENVYIPLAPMGYSDNVHSQSFALFTEAGYGEPAEVNDLYEKARVEAVKAVAGIKPMTTRDVLAVAMLEGKAYQDNQSLLENLHGMQNNIIGKEIANEFFGRPNLSFVYRDNAGSAKGYILAYEGMNGGRPEIYLSDLAADPDSRLAGGRLIQEFFETYQRSYGTAEKPFMPIFTNARDKTSFAILERQIARLSAKSGFVMEMQEVGTHYRGEDLFHDVRIFIGRDASELAAQKARYEGLGMAESEYEGTGDERY